MELIPRNADLLWPLLWASLLLLSLVRLFQAERLALFLRLPFTARGREWAGQFGPFGPHWLSDSLLTAAGFIPLVLALSWLMREVNQEPLSPDFPAFLLRAFLLLVGYVFFKALLSSLVGSIFEQGTELIQLQNQFGAYLAWGGIALWLPVTLSLYWPEWRATLNVFLLLLLLITLLLAILQSSVRLLQLRAKVGHIILYLCALEIIPLSYLILILEKI